MVNHVSAHESWSLCSEEIAARQELEGMISNINIFMLKIFYQTQENMLWMAISRSRESPEGCSCNT